jgi:hypothetical protein
MEKRYRALRIISTLYKIAGAIVLVFAILGAVGACLAGVLGGSAMEQLSRDLGGGGLISGAVAGIVGGIAALIGGGLSGLTIYATGEGISLLIAMEENTRATAQYLAAQARPAVPAPASPSIPPPPTGQ